MSYYLGIDVSKAKYDVHLITPEGRWSGVFDNTPSGYKKLGKWLQKRQVEQLHACLEATGRYGEKLANWLHQAGHQVSIVKSQSNQALWPSQITAKQNR